MQNKIEKGQIKNIYLTFRDLEKSYQKKPQSLSVQDWLAKKYQVYLFGLPENEAVELAKLTLNGVDRFQQNLKEIMASAALGKSKEQWFVEAMERDLQGIDINEAGNQLKILDQALIIGNNQIINEDIVSIDDSSMEIEMPQVNLKNETVEESWNHFTVKDTLLNIAQNATLMGLQTVADDKSFDFTSDALKAVPVEELFSPDEISHGNEHIKALLAAAIKINSGTEKLSLWPESVPMDVVTALASHGVEYYTAMSDFSLGKKTLMQTMEHMGMSGISAFYSIFSARGIKNISTVLFSHIPIIGPVLGNIVGSVVSIAVDRKLHEKIRNMLHKVKQTVQAAVHTTWEKIKATGRKIKDKVKSFCDWLLT